MKAELGAMKTIIVALIASCVVSLAQTSTNNSDSASDKNTHPDATGQLLKAERSGDTETIKMLLKNGVDVNSKETADGSTALMWAAVEGHNCWR
jgi:ankyrin repeat protein